MTPHPINYPVVTPRTSTLAILTIVLATATVTGVGTPPDGTADVVYGQLGSFTTADLNKQPPLLMITPASRAPRIYGRPVASQPIGTAIFTLLIPATIGCCSSSRGVSRRVLSRIVYTGSPIL